MTKRIIFEGGPMRSTPEPGPNTPDRPFPIVGIGASAGGLNPLVRFLSALPDEFCFTLVFMERLSAMHKSFLPEPLSSRPFLKLQNYQEQRLRGHESRLKLSGAYQ